MKIIFCKPFGVNYRGGSINGIDSPLPEVSIASHPLTMPVKTRKIQLIFVIYWLLLGYIVAALIFWFIALNQQNQQMARFKIERLNKESQIYDSLLTNINIEKKKKTIQYIGEGSTFLLLILCGAIFVYRSFRKQLRQGIEQQNFMIAITHELKTPIAITKLNLETLQKRRLDESQQQRLIHNTLQEANRLNTLSTNMLLSSQIEAGGYQMTKEETNWTDIVKTGVKDFCTRYPERTVVVDIEQDIFVAGDKLLLEIIVNNLIENALKYSAKDAPIKVLLFSKSKQAVLQVVDQGAGIAEDEKQKVFQKYYRIGNEATKRAKGTGLGLYLTKRIVTSHGGKIIIINNSTVGSTFEVTLDAES